MARKTLATHRAEIQASIARGHGALCLVTPVTGQLWWRAAKALEEEGIVSVVGAHPTPSDWYVCIPPDSTWDYDAQKFTRT